MLATPKRKLIPLTASLFFILSVTLFFATSAFSEGDEDSGAAEQSGTPALSCDTIPPLMKAFQRNHVSETKMDGKLFSRVAEQFVKRVDPSKTLLRKSDADSTSTFVMNFMKKLESPNCKQLDQVKDIMIMRMQEQLNFVKKTLDDKKYKLDENVEIIIDADKRTYAKDKKEFEAKLLKNVHFQISNYLAADEKIAGAKKKLVRRYERMLKRTKDLKKEDIYEMMVNAFASALDPHSSYFTADTLEDFQISMRLSLEGIGASLTSEDGYTVIQELIKGGAAHASQKLEPKDKIIAVGQGSNGALEDVIDMDLRDVVKKIRGKSGTTVRLKILRAKGEVERFIVSLKRSKVKLEDDAVKVTYKEKKVGDKTLKLARLELPSFYGDAELKERSSYRDMAKALDEIRKNKADGLLLDFSGNGGGRLEEAVKIAGLFIKEGNIVATKDSRRQIQSLKDEDPRLQWDGPMVILVSRASASASEIVAGALKDYKRAVVIGGDHSFGKGSVQSVMPLPPGLGAMKVTIGLFFIPSGVSTQHHGVDVDVAIPSVFTADDYGERFLDNSLKPDAISSFLSKNANTETLAWKPISTKEIRKLAENSKHRVEKNKKFDEVRKEIAELKERHGILKLADLRKKNKERKSKETKDDTSKKDEDKPGPDVEESFNVLADLIFLQKGQEEMLAISSKSPN